MKIEDAKIRDSFTTAKTGGLVSKRVSAFNDGNRSEIVYLSVDQLVPYRNQARKIFDETELQQLAETIKDHGIRQPLTVLCIEGEPVAFEVISGERRLRAAKMAGLLKVPCIVIKDNEKAEEIALVENIQRKDLHPIELARALKKISDKRGWGGQTELNKKLGLSKSTVSELLKLCEFSEPIQDAILSSNVRGREIFRKLFLIKSDKEKLSFIESLNGFTDDEKTESTQRKALTRQSVLRISFGFEGIHIQKGKLTKLSQEEKNTVKMYLLKIVDELSS